MTNQQIFDKVATHLLKQGAKSQQHTGEQPTCAYRGENGMMCAVGCLIKDEDYRPAFEGYGVAAIPNYKEQCNFDVKFLADALSKAEIDVNSSDTVLLLSELQQLHDQTAPSEWPERLRYVAIDWAFNTRVLDNHTELEDL